MAEKDQFMVAIRRDTRDRMDALRIVLGLSRAEIGRRILDDGVTLARLERANLALLARLHTLARECDLGWQEVVGKYIEKYRTGGPSLEALERNPYQTVGLRRLKVLDEPVEVHI